MVQDRTSKNGEIRFSRRAIPTGAGVEDDGALDIPLGYLKSQSGVALGLATALQNSRVPDEVFSLTLSGEYKERFGP